MSPPGRRGGSAAWKLMLALLGACGPGPEAVSPPEGGEPVLPLGITFVPAPQDNPSNPEGVALGRWLFYSPLLSGNGRVSCASCHVQSHAFSLDASLATVGVSGRPLVRHAPALINLAWMDGLFWDGGAKNLESLSLGPITHPDEMGQGNLQALMERLASTPEAVQRFEAAFGPGGPTLGQLLRALAQFQRTLVSARSRYDLWRRGEPGGELSALEQAGYGLVRARCTPCHDTELFTDNAYHNNGLDSVWGEGEDETRGRGRITLEPEDTGRYKTPTLRNVTRSAPYMHDGRFATLDAVLEHYRQGVVPSPTLDIALRGDGQQAPGLSLSDVEKAAVLAFLDTLTDEAFLSDPALGPPGTGP
ncbi:cytochrome c551 peroxidase [Cystobacter fuscus]|uniref:Cytochrome c551 peroxidase n=1 Tax=Cystobacter fuscus TaxID=43 RepID=A0A250JHH1_9BACT|nr:cytochrome c peroxidase [Cystobacter fuscus]ATB43344.1 cytochrome c551 peroxidase [Cystobacter fuscus]